VTTLEEVFIKIGEEEESKNNKNELDQSSSSIS
jgi:hypothetical protein